VPAMAGEGGPTSHPQRVPYAVSIEPVHKSPLPSAVRERWAQSCKENSAAASPNGTCEAALSELADADARQVLQRSPVASPLWLCTPYGLAGGHACLEVARTFQMRFASSVFASPTRTLGRSGWLAQVLHPSTTSTNNPRLNDEETEARARRLQVGHHGPINFLHTCRARGRQCAGPAWRCGGGSVQRLEHRVRRPHAGQRFRSGQTWAASKAPWQPASRSLGRSARASSRLASARPAAESLLAQVLPRCTLADSRPRRRAQERLALADANRRSQLAERRTKAVAFSAKTQEAAARLQARSAAIAERLRTSLADAQARALPWGPPQQGRGAVTLCSSPGVGGAPCGCGCKQGAATALVGERRSEVLQQWVCSLLAVRPHTPGRGGERVRGVRGRRRAGRVRRRSAQPGWRARRIR